jgi:flavin reductase (DIM6/NTAB) family NADH-FMN oxidoreductase RutF
MLKEVDIFDVCHETLDKLDGEGILLVAGDPPNPMTIGWATVGHIWHKQVMTVLVRPTRHTYDLMETAKDFSVCVLPGHCKKELNLCGTKSGRDVNKIEACHFQVEKCLKADAYFIAGSDIHFECRIAHKHRLDPATLDPLITDRYYPLKDFHMVYYGEILGIYRRG